MPSTASVPELTRVTVSTPRRRLDVALPAQAPVAELLPELLRHAGQAAGVEAAHREWVLRRVDGATLAGARGLQAQGVRDGEVLHLVPATLDWPEVVFDDVRAAVVSGVRGRGRAWSPVLTAWCARVGAGVALAGGLGLVAYHPTDPLLPAIVAASLLAAAALGGRAGHGSAATLPLAAAPPYAGVAGLGWMADLGWSGGAELVGAAGGWLVAAVLAAMVARAGSDRVAAAAVVVVGLLAVPAALVGQAAQAAWGTSAVLAAAAALACGLAGGVGVLPEVAIRLARPPAAPVTEAGAFPAVARVDDLLTGALAAWAVLVAVVLVTLAYAGGAAAPTLAAATALAVALRAWRFIAVRHRLPLLVAGAVGLVAAAGFVLRAVPLAMVPVLLIGLVAVALLLARIGPDTATEPSGEAAGVGQRSGRVTGGVETLAVVSVVPLAAWVLGLYSLATS